MDPNADVVLRLVQLPELDAACEAGDEDACSLAQAQRLYDTTLEAVEKAKSTYDARIVQLKAEGADVVARRAEIAAKLKAKLQKKAGAAGELPVSMTNTM